MNFLGKGVGAADEEQRRPLARLRVARMAEITVIDLVAASDLDHLDGRIVQRRGGAEVFLAFPETGRLFVVAVDPQEDVGHAPVLVGGEEIFHGRAFVPVGEAFFRPRLGIFGLSDPGLFPARQVARLDLPAHARDLEHVAAALAGLGDQPQGLRAHALRGEKEIDHVAGLFLIIRLPILLSTSPRHGKPRPRSGRCRGGAGRYRSQFSAATRGSRSKYARSKYRSHFGVSQRALIPAGCSRTCHDCACSGA